MSATLAPHHERCEPRLNLFVIIRFIINGHKLVTNAPKYSLQAFIQAVVTTRQISKAFKKIFIAAREIVCPNPEIYQGGLQRRK
jgi:hypothetical protein